MAVVVAEATNQNKALLKGKELKSLFHTQDDLRGITKAQFKINKDNLEFLMMKSYCSAGVSNSMPQRLVSCKFEMCA